MSARNDEEWRWREEKKNLKTFLMIKIWSLNTISEEKKSSNNNNTGAGGLHWAGYIGKEQQQD